MLEEKLVSIKDFLTTYIKTYQNCLNTTNPDFMIELVKSSSEFQNAFIETYTKELRLSNEHECDDESELESEYNERNKQLFKQMICGLNDFDETMDSSKQVKMHKNLVECYFMFIRKNIRDFVPKHIKYVLVNEVLDCFDHYMNEYLFTPYVINQSFDKVLAEEESIVEDRYRVEKMLSAVNKALENMVDI